MKKRGHKHSVKAQIVTPSNQKKTLTPQGRVLFTPPKTADKIIADLKRFSQRLVVLAEQVKHLRGTHKNAKRNAKTCNNYATEVLKNGLNERTEKYWSTCNSMTNNLELYIKNM